MEWIVAKGQELESSVKETDPPTHVKVDVAHTGYADDMKEFNMARGDREALDVIGRSGVLLDMAIAPSSITQNRDKAEHIATFYGPGQAQYAKGLQRDMQDGGLGKVKGHARYLGGWPQANGGVRVVVSKRVLAGKEAYYSMGRSWQSQVSLVCKSRFSTARVGTDNDIGTLCITMTLAKVAASAGTTTQTWTQTQTYFFWQPLAEPR